MATIQITITLSVFPNYPPYTDRVIYNNDIINFVGTSGLASRWMLLLKRE